VRVVLKLETESDMPRVALTAYLLGREMFTKKESAHYPDLDQFFLGYLGQNYLYCGSTMREVVEGYKQDCNAAQLEATINDMVRFARSHPNDLDAAFDVVYGTSVDPALWDHTTASFFAELERLLRAPVRLSRE
jgi:hypothetical protein